MFHLLRVKNLSGIAQALAMPSCSHRHTVKLHYSATEAAVIAAFFGVSHSRTMAVHRRALKRRKTETDMTYEDRKRVLVVKMALDGASLDLMLFLLAMPEKELSKLLKKVAKATSH